MLRFGKIGNNKLSNNKERGKINFINNAALNTTLICIKIYDKWKYTNLYNIRRIFISQIGNK